MVFVLILIAITTVIGSSLLAESSVTALSLQGISNASRARYLAESGIHHAACLLKENPQLVKASLGSAMGPYSLSDGGQYSIVITELTTPGYFSVSSTASSLTATQTVTAILRHTSGLQDKIDYAFLSTNDVGLIMSDTKVKGTAHCNREFYNLGVVEGDLQACQSIYNYGIVNNGSIITPASYTAGPIRDINDYRTYQFGDEIGFADLHTDNEFSKYEDIRGYNAITSDNPAGVVLVTPSSGYLSLRYDFDFYGTLIVDGHIIIAGSGIDLKPRAGFPAILTSGSILVRNNTEMEIEGVVICGYGFGGYNSESYGSNLEIDGSLVSLGYGNRPDLYANLVIEYDSDKATLYDPTGYGTGGEVTLITWE